MNECVFCKIVAGEIPTLTVYEDESYVAFLDITPLNRGHVQVIPKQHYRWVWDDPTIGHYMEVAQKIARAQKTAFQTDWVVSLISGEQVAHAHMWLVPRTDGDGHGGFLNMSEVKKISPADMERIAEELRTALKKA